MIKYSRQRECILKNVAGRCDHPTADMVYRDVRIDYPNISLGTVYRNLSLLADMGQILKITMPNGPDRFDRTLDPHGHFLCRKCGQVWDVFPGNLPALMQEVPASVGVIETCSLQLTGLCSRCMAEKEQSVT